MGEQKSYRQYYWYGEPINGKYAKAYQRVSASSYNEAREKVKKHGVDGGRRVVKLTITYCLDKDNQ